jgi:uncharacterized protein (DUF1684 family)
MDDRLILEEGETIMQAVKQIIDAEKLKSIIDIPDGMRHRQVEVIVLPLDMGPLVNQKTETTLERIARFREKHNHETFIGHLKRKLAEGFQFDFDAEKIINGTETEKEKQQRYRMEKQVWQDIIAEKLLTEKP